ncbi:ATP-binding protein [Streptomyces sp. NPDC048277]|uniref:AAA family ATPase n=1 Tax=Streptomyces sp. NPDC048277 TaxID=3155027 RepID=UPI00340758E2
MLLNFRVANHRSIRDELEWQLQPVYADERPPGAGWEAVPVAGIFGSNAAGKSNVVDALRYTAEMVNRSHLLAEDGEGVSRQPFLADVVDTDSSWYVADLLLSGVRYVYGFEVDDECVVGEWLYAYPEGRKRVVFEREGDGFRVGSSQDKQKELRTVADVTAPNALFLSMAGRSRAVIDVVSPVYGWFRFDLAFGGATVPGFRPRSLWLRELAHRLNARGEPPHLRELLRVADLGIEDYRVVSAEEEVSGARAAVAVTDKETLADTLRTRSRTRHELLFKHTGRNGVFEVPLSAESAGTQALVDYAFTLEGVARRGGTLVVDELGSSLHPRLSAFLVGLFQDPARNPKGAQLLFTSHDVSLLGRRAGQDILKRDHIWFVTKNEFGESSLYPLSDFHPRQEENRERRYLSGSYGAVPMIDDTFTLAIAGRGETGGEGSEEGRPESSEA